MEDVKAIGDIRSMRCDECGFEFVYVTPEEHDIAPQIMLDHAEVKHPNINIQITNIQH